MDSPTEFVRNNMRILTEQIAKIKKCNKEKEKIEYIPTPQC